MVHQTESVVLSDDSVLRYAMSQRQADTQNTKSNIPPVWKTVGISRGVTYAIQVLHRAYDKTQKKILHRAWKKKTSHVAKVILHRAYAEKHKKILIKEYRKKTKSGKNPIKVERKKTQPNKKKKICMVKYHTGKQQKNSKIAKNAKLAECQALAEIRLFEKDVKT